MSASTEEGRRKSFWQRALTNRSVSRRKAAGGKRNKKHKFVGSFGSDSRR